MQARLSLILLTAFISVAVFGFIGMGHTLTHSSCIAATAQGMTGCTKGDGPLSEAGFHLGLFKHFSQALVNTLVVLAALVAVFLAVWSIANTIAHSTNLPAYTVIIRETSQIFKRAHVRMLHWLQTLSKRDPESGFWVHNTVALT